MEKKEKEYRSLIYFFRGSNERQAGSHRGFLRKSKEDSFFLRLLLVMYMCLSLALEHSSACLAT
jgi:hypothetical protein